MKNIILDSIYRDTSSNPNVTEFTSTRNSLNYNGTKLLNNSMFYKILNVSLPYDVSLYDYPYLNLYLYNVDQDVTTNNMMINTNKIMQFILFIDNNLTNSEFIGFTSKMISKISCFNIDKDIIVKLTYPDGTPITLFPSGSVLRKEQMVVLLAVSSEEDKILILN